MSPTTGCPAFTGSIRLVRQPIMHRSGRVYGFELLARPGMQDHNSPLSADQLEQATGMALASLADPNWRTRYLCGRPAFVNLTRRHLLRHPTISFPTQAAVLEILEDIALDDEACVAIAALAGRGYRLALDDMSWTPQHHQALPYVRYVKIDVLNPHWPTIDTVIQHCRPHHHLQFIAERIETPASYQRCLASGFTLFQGHHLAPPAPLTPADSPLSHTAPTKMTKGTTTTVNQDAATSPTGQDPTPEPSVDSYADLVLDGIADLRRMITGWSAQAWQLLADTAHHDGNPAGGLVDRARSRALVAAVEHNRMELVRYTRDELHQQIPLSLTAWEHQTTGQALDDAALALITADQITPTDFQHLLTACRRAADHP